MPPSKKQEKTTDPVKSVGLTPSQTEHLVMAYLCMEKTKVSERLCALISKVFELNVSLLDRLTGRSLGSFATSRLPLLERFLAGPNGASRNGRNREPLLRLSRRPRKLRTTTRTLMGLWRLHPPRVVRIRMK